MAGAYPSFCSIKQLRVLLLPPGWDTSPSQGYPQQYVAGTHFIHLGGGETMWSNVCCLRKQHDGRTWPRITILTTTPMHHLSTVAHAKVLNFKSNLQTNPCKQLSQTEPSANELDIYKLFRVNCQSNINVKARKRASGLTSILDFRKLLRLRPKKLAPLVLRLCCYETCALQLFCCETREVDSNS